MPRHKPPTKKLSFFGSSKVANQDSIYRGGQFKGTEDDNELVTQINSRREVYLEESRTTRRQWLQNAAFARSQQWSILHRTEDRLITLQEPGKKRMITLDLIGPWKEHMIANMVTAQPKYEAIPANTDAEAVSAARLGTDILMYYWESWQFSLQYIELCGYLIDFGSAFIYLNYKEDFSRYVARELLDPETGEIILSDDGQPVTQKSAIGDINSTVLAPQNVFQPMTPTPFKDKPWVAIQQQQSLDYFTETYDDGKDVLEEVIDYKNSYGLKTINSDSEYKQPASATEIIYFQKPSDINPEGMVVVTAGNVLLSRDVWPYNKLLEYPIEHFSCRKESGEFYARSWIERQIPIQKLYNVVWSIITDNADDMGHQKLLRPNNSGIRTPSDLPEIIDYNPPYKPEYLALPPMPQYIVDMLPMLEAKMRDVQNYHGASLGTSVSGVRSDIHAQNLQDQDMLPLTVVDNMMQATFESTGEKTLLITSEKLTEERIIQFVGENKRIMVRNFKGAMLQDTRKVKVRMTNAWMRSKGATEKTILQAYQMGAIADRFRQPDPGKLIRLLEFALPDSIFRDMQQSTEIAYHEIETILNGEMPMIFPWQDQKMFIEVLTEFMNSSQFIQIARKAQEKDSDALKIFQIFVEDVRQRTQIFTEAMKAIAPQQPQQGRAGQESPKKPQQAAKQRRA